MGMPALAIDWTAERVRALPDDGNRYEVVDGELLVTPAPAFRHQYVVGELHLRLSEYLRPRGFAHVMMSPADIELDPRTLVQPDLFVFPIGLAVKVRDWRDIAGLLLAVEVLSPSTARYDRQVKRRRYQREGVPEYWIVDSDARLFERWRPEDERPEILAERLVWLPPGADDPMELALPEMFATALKWV